MASQAGAFGPPGAAYPIQVEFDPDPNESRLWGIPLLGMLARMLLLIPHLIVIALVGLIVGILSLVLWIPVLLFGTYPAIGYQFVGGLLRWSARLSAYVWLMPGGYPPFSLDGEHPTSVEFDESRTRMNRLWGIPFAGPLVRWILLIPHYLALWVLGIVAFFGLWVLWFPILTTGRYPDWGYSLYGGLGRWSLRVQAYQSMMPVPYPPFALRP